MNSKLQSSCNIDFNTNLEEREFFITSKTHLNYIAKVYNECGVSAANLVINILITKIIKEKDEDWYITHNKCSSWIAERLGVSRTNLVKTIKTLLNKGLIKKESSQLKSDAKFNKFHKINFLDLDTNPTSNKNYFFIHKTDIRNVFQSTEYTAFEKILYLYVISFNHSKFSSRTELEDYDGIWLNRRYIAEKLGFADNDGFKIKLRSFKRKFKDRGLLQIKIGNSELCKSNSLDNTTIFLTNLNYKTILESIINKKNLKLASEKPTEYIDKLKEDLRNGNLDSQPEFKASIPSHYSIPDKKAPSYIEKLQQNLLDSQSPRSEDKTRSFLSQGVEETRSISSQNPIETHPKPDRNQDTPLQASDRNEESDILSPIEMQKVESYKTIETNQQPIDVKTQYINKRNVNINFLNINITHYSDFIFGSFHDLKKQNIKFPSYVSYQTDHEGKNIIRGLDESILAKTKANIELDRLLNKTYDEAIEEFEFRLGIKLTNDIVIALSKKHHALTIDLIMTFCFILDAEISTLGFKDLFKQSITPSGLVSIFTTYIQNIKNKNFQSLDYTYARYVSNAEDCFMKNQDMAVAADDDLSITVNFATPAGEDHTRCYRGEDRTNSTSEMKLERSRKLSQEAVTYRKILMEDVSLIFPDLPKDVVKHGCYLFYATVKAQITALETQEALQKERAIRLLRSNFMRIESKISHSKKHMHNYLQLQAFPELRHKPTPRGQDNFNTFRPYKSEDYYKKENERLLEASFKYEIMQEVKEELARKKKQQELDAVKEEAEKGLQALREANIVLGKIE